MGGCIGPPQAKYDSLAAPERGQCLSRVRGLGRALHGSRRGCLLRSVLGLRALDRRDLIGAYAERGVDLGLELHGYVRVLVQERLGVVATLAEPFLAVGEEGAGLGDDVLFNAEVDQAAGGRDATAELDVELGLPEGGGELVLDDL